MPMLGGTRRALLSGSRVPAWVLSGAALHLDFAGNRLYGASSFTDLLSCSRASTGYAETVAGALTSFATNTLRRTDKGLLVEEARTNTVQQSQTFDTTWLTTAATVSPNVIAAPDGTVTADRIVETATTNIHRVLQGVGHTSAVVYAESVFLKAGERTWAVVSFGWTNGGAWFDLQNGVVGTIQSGVSSATIEAFANGWYRCKIVGTAPASATDNFGVFVASADGVSNYVGDGTSGIYVWGAQLELGSFPTSYIPTTTASATRALDRVAATNALLTLLTRTEGSVIADIIAVRASAGTWNARIVGSVGGDKGPLYLTNNTTVGTYNNAVALTTPIGASGQAINGVKLGVGWSASGRSVLGKGGTVATDANLMSAPSDPTLGSSFSGGAETVNGYIRRLAVWDSRLANATFQALTV